MQGFKRALRYDALVFSIEHDRGIVFFHHNASEIVSRYQRYLVSPRFAPIANRRFVSRFQLRQEIAHGLVDALHVPGVRAQVGDCLIGDATALLGREWSTTDET